MFKKEQLPLYIALLVPLLMIILVAGFVYLPGIGQKPKINFVYMTGSNVYYGGYGQQYIVNGGHLISNPQPVNSSPNPPGYNPVVNTQVNFFLYDVSKNSAQEITFQQASKYNLDPGMTSPDGYTVARGSGSGGDFLFGGAPGDYNSWFIKGHNRSKKLNLKLTGSSYYDNFQFLGWVE